MKHDDHRAIENEKQPKPAAPGPRPAGPNQFERLTRSDTEIARRVKWLKAYKAGEAQTCGCGEKPTHMDSYGYPVCHICFDGMTQHEVR